MNEEIAKWYSLILYGPLLTILLYVTITTYLGNNTFDSITIDGSTTSFFFPVLILSLIVATVCTAIPVIQDIIFLESAHPAFNQLCIACSVMATSIFVFLIDGSIEEDKYVSYVLFVFVLIKIGLTYTGMNTVRMMAVGLSVALAVLFIGIYMTIGHMLDDLSIYLDIVHIQNLEVTDDALKGTRSLMLILGIITLVTAVLGTALTILGKSVHGVILSVVSIVTTALGLFLLMGWHAMFGEPIFLIIAAMALILPLVTVVTQKSSYSATRKVMKSSDREKAIEKGKNKIIQLGEKGKLFE